MKARLANDLVKYFTLYEVKSCTVLESGEYEVSFKNGSIGIALPNNENEFNDYDLDDVQIWLNAQEDKNLGLEALVDFYSKP